MACSSDVIVSVVSSCRVLCTLVHGHVSPQPSYGEGCGGSGFEWCVCCLVAMVSPFPLDSLTVMGPGSGGIRGLNGQIHFSSPLGSGHRDALVCSCVEVLQRLSVLNLPTQLLQLDWQVMNLDKGGHSYIKGSVKLKLTLL